MIIVSLERQHRIMIHQEALQLGLSSIRFWATGFGLACLLLVAKAQNIPENPLRRPNIILMMADDMGMGDTSAYQDFTGNPDTAQLATPAMERLADSGIRFTDAHTPGSRCTPTRYSLLTGRYPWRTRLKWWVLFGAQGDPLIERGRPTLATLVKEVGYRTAMVGKWHVGLRYRQRNSQPAAGWDDAFFMRPLFTSPLDHGFDFARFTSRSHGTSGPTGISKNPAKSNHPEQNVGPGHIHGRIVMGTSGRGRQLVSQGPNAYVLEDLGSRHSNHAIEFLETHLRVPNFRKQPFFLYYPSNSNHSPYTPSKSIDDRPVAGAAKTKSGQPMDARHDYIYENDVALARLLDWLAKTEDPRRPGFNLSENTLVIFTSDNGAEKNSNIATGPFRSNKGSCYEGGHRVPFIIRWPAGGMGDGDPTNPGTTNRTVIGLQDLFATFSEILGIELPDLSSGEYGAEDSQSFLAALKGTNPLKRGPIFFADHKESTKSDPAVLALRYDDPLVGSEVASGQWKLFFDASLIRYGEVKPFELYDLSQDPEEKQNLIDSPQHQKLINELKTVALRHRTVAGHRFANLASTEQVQLDWSAESAEIESIREMFEGQTKATVSHSKSGLEIEFETTARSPDQRAPQFTVNSNGLGLKGSHEGRFQNGAGVLLRFNQDVIVQFVGLRSADGSCGGYYQIGKRFPLQLYCEDGDNDSKEQHGRVSDIGMVKANQTLRLDSGPHLGVESPGSWVLRNLSVRLLKD